MGKTRSCDVDVLVIGGGASGLWAALAAAGAGARTALVERCARIGARIACAEGVSRSGLSELVAIRPDWVAASIDGARLVGPDGCDIRVREAGAGVVLHKELFLRGLAELAARQGVDIRVSAEAAGVRAAPRGRLEVLMRPGPDDLPASYRCAAVVGADGIGSRTGRAARIRPPVAPEELFLCAQSTVAPIDLDPRTVEFHFSNEFAPGGYAWVFPKGEAIANLGVGIAPASPAFKRRRGASLAGFLRLFRERRAPCARELSRVVGGVPAEKEPYEVSSGGIFLAGDAARVADPLTGGGIVPGMLSGEVSGKFAARWAAGGDVRADLARECARAMKSQFKDRKFRVAARRVLVEMSDQELARMIRLVGEYVADGAPLRAEPALLLKFMVKSMPSTFRLARHLLTG